MTNAYDFSKWLTGFDFLKQLTQNQQDAISGKAPQTANFANWIAPTLSVEEIEKRISELKSVQFWINQNEAAIKATIQALEVQKMTLGALNNMNLDMSQMAKAFQINPFQAAVKSTTTSPNPSPAKEAQEEKTEKPLAPDPMQWWQALTGQFQEIAANVVKESAQNFNEQIAQFNKVQEKAAPPASPSPSTTTKTATRKTAAKSTAKTTATTPAKKAAAKKVSAKKPNQPNP